MTLNQIRNFAIAFVLAAVAAFGQTALTTTTLSANIDNRQQTFSIASATGVAVFANAGPAQGGIGSPSSYAGSNLFIDQENMVVVGLNGTTVTVRRGVGTAARAHNSSAVVYVAPSVAIKTGPDPTGQCQRTLLPYVPYINQATGHTFDCLGVTTAGQWFQTNSPGGNLGLVGSTVTSANTITPTGLMFAVSGTTLVKTITVPAGFAPGMSIAIRPTGIFATDTTGNIGLVTSATVVGRILIMTWDGSKFWPSYVS